MTLKETKEVAARGESEQIEFKRTTGTLSAAIETVCAMLNGRGGYVLIGVKDDGTVTGQQVADKTLRDVSQELSKIEPQAVLQPERVDVAEDRAAIVLSVPGERAGPYTYDGRAYVRQGPTTRKMQKAEYERRLIAQRDPAQRWESRPAQDTTPDDLDAAELSRTIDEAVRRGRTEEPGTRDPDELLRGLGLLHGDQLLNAAVVLFGQPDRLMPYYPQCLLRMARFRGTTKSEFEDNRQARGHAFALFQQAQRFLLDHLPIASRVLPDAIEREDTPLYPMEALREALANAFCHRDYSIGGGSVGIALFDDRLEITSTGALPPGITLADLTQPHVSKPRNDLIADAFYKRGIIEQWGRGTLKIVEVTEQAGLATPEFEERGGELVVRFRPLRYVAPSRIEHDLTALQQEIMQIVGNLGPLPLSDIMDALSEEVPRRTVQKTLRTLRDLDLLIMKGRTKGARWTIPSA